MAVIFLIFFFVLHLHADNRSIEPFGSFVIGKNMQARKMPFLLALVSPTPILREYVNLLQLMFACDAFKTVGFAITVQKFSTIPSSSAIKKLFSTFPLALFINTIDDTALEWRLYDTQHAHMIKGGKLSLHNVSLQGHAEHVVDQVWTLLTGQTGFFSTRIAFCREIKKSDKRRVKQLCLIPPYFDPQKHNINDWIQILVEGGKLFGPRWNRDQYAPLVLYSEGTHSNVRLVSVNLNKQRRIVSNLEGLNLLPTFSFDGKTVVYCLSKNGKSQLYQYALDQLSNTYELKPLVMNEGNNISPYLCSNGDVVFCSDFKSKKPQICIYRASAAQIETITSEGYCTCPTVNEKSGLIAYCKNVQGYMQIFVYRINTKTHEQLTTDRTNKEECSWSSCGNYLTYSVDDGKTSRIAILNFITRERAFLTPESENCTYPNWSPFYAVPLVST